MDINKAQQVIEQIEQICQTNDVAIVGLLPLDGKRAVIEIIDINDLTIEDKNYIDEGDLPYKVNNSIVVNGIYYNPIK